MPQMQAARQQLNVIGKEVLFSDYQYPSFPWVACSFLKDTKVEGITITHTSEQGVGCIPFLTHVNSSWKSVLPSVWNFGEFRMGGWLRMVWSQLLGGFVLVAAVKRAKMDKTRKRN